MFDDARGAVPLSLSAAGRTSVMLLLPSSLPATVAGGDKILEHWGRMEPLGTGGFRLLLVASQPIRLNVLNGAKRWNDLNDLNTPFPTIAYRLTPHAYSCLIHLRLTLNS